MVPSGAVSKPGTEAAQGDREKFAELLMSSLSESAKPRPVNAVLPLLRQLSALSPTDHHIIRPALPAARTPFSGQVTKRPLLNGSTKSGRKK